MLKKHVIPAIQGVLNVWTLHQLIVNNVDQGLTKLLHLHV